MLHSVLSRELPEGPFSAHRRWRLPPCPQVQSGFGRTGEWFASDGHYGVAPDILVMAKGLASGYPLAAIATRPEISASQPAGSMGGTYAGNAVACAAAVETIAVIKDEGAHRPRTVSPPAWPRAAIPRPRASLLSSPLPPHPPRALLLLRGVGGVAYSFYVQCCCPAGCPPTRMCRPCAHNLLPPHAGPVRHIF